VASLDVKKAAHPDVSKDLSSEVISASVWEEQVNLWRSSLKDWCGALELNAVIHVAGGFHMGGVKDGTIPVENMWEMNGKSAFAAAALASSLLADEGLFVLTGAKLVYDGGLTNFAVGYGMSKAATHQLARDFAASYERKRCFCILPNVLDTPSNRAGMPNADFSKWTSLDDVSKQIVSWASEPTATKHNNGDFIYV